MVRTSSMSSGHSTPTVMSPQTSNDGMSSGNVTPVKATFAIMSEGDSIGSSSSSSSLTSPPPIPARSYSLTTPKSSPVPVDIRPESAPNGKLDLQIGNGTNGDSTPTPDSETTPEVGRTPEPNVAELENTLCSMTEKETDV